MDRAEAEMVTELFGLQGSEEMNSVMVLKDFIKDMAFELHVEGIVNDHQLERKLERHPNSQNCMCGRSLAHLGNCEEFDGVKFVWKEVAGHETGQMS